MFKELKGTRLKEEKEDVKTMPRQIENKEPNRILQLKSIVSQREKKNHWKGSIVYLDWHKKESRNLKLDQ